MSASFRISGKGRLTQAKAARFTFDYKSYAGVEGDTLASALLANGVHLVGRSFKYHRPRGILSAGAEEPNALVGVHREHIVALGLLETGHQRPAVAARGRAEHAGAVLLGHRMGVGVGLFVDNHDLKGYGQWAHRGLEVREQLG